MIDGNCIRSSQAGTHSIFMPHLVFQIDEILRPIAENVGRVSKPTAVKFARCCRAFEEPALRPLWENATLENLMYVLPADVLYFSGPGLHVVSPPPPRSLSRLETEASIRFRGPSANSLQPNVRGYFDTRRGSGNSVGSQSGI